MTTPRSDLDLCEFVLNHPQRSLSPADREFCRSIRIRTVPLPDKIRKQLEELADRLAKK